MALENESYTLDFSDNSTNGVPILNLIWFPIDICLYFYQLTLLLNTSTQQWNSTRWCWSLHFLYHIPFHMKGVYPSLSLHKFQSSFMFGDISQELFLFVCFDKKMVNIFSILYKTLDVLGRIREMKYVNAVFQTNIASIYNKLCLTHKSDQIIFNLT